MSIYPSTKVLPYVYLLTNKDSGEFYIGSRFANSVPSSDDIGIKYFTSSKYIKPIFNKFHITVLAEFFNKNDAYLYEQDLIFENWKHPLILNKNVRKGHLHIHPSCYKSEERSRKLKENHHDVKGCKNPKARKVKITEPSGKEHILIGGYVKFVIDNNLSMHSIHRMLNGFNCHKTSKIYGWKAEYM